MSVPRWAPIPADRGARRSAIVGLVLLVLVLVFVVVVVFVVRVFVFFRFFVLFLVFVVVFVLVFFVLVGFAHLDGSVVVELVVTFATGWLVQLFERSGHDLTFDDGSDVVPRAFASWSGHIPTSASRVANATPSACARQRRPAGVVE
ncbi:MAG: hypothetical protein ACHQRO_04485, partial [Vicinamibacteria bacterium]